MVNESWESRIKRSVFLGIELLDHVVILFFFFLRTARLFSKMAVPFYIITSNVRGFQFLHFLACVCVCVCTGSVAQLCPLLHAMDYSPPGSSVHGISQTRILEWVAISFSRGSS